MRVKYWDELADSQKKYVVDFLNQVQNNLERIEKINSDCEDLVDKFMATVDPVGDTCNLATDSVEFFVDDCVDSGAGQSHDLAKAFYKQYVIQEQHAELSAILG